ncbi:hypothetical protein [Prevotella sp. tf2-5]|uniref:hypothetical protein n=1 Tax=Prevotella sp. tf2-5 TaxID=1761889 RepID=UPI0008E659F1|nr:hypothetical protein [Prevotella sp. tf2-5]SFO62370.1 hypothetical protein SAMN04487852_103317 [Prevotella sp. tf2-5]
MEKLEFYKRCIEDCDRAIKAINGRTDLTAAKKAELIDGLLDSRKIILDLILELENI